MKIAIATLSRLLVTRALFAGSVRAINEAPASGPLTRFASAINEELGTGQDEWLKLRFGVYPNVVGLQVFDREAAERMVSAFNSLSARYATLFRGQPIYVGHPDDAEWRRANPGVREEAVGRIKELKIEPDGLLMRRAFNDEGQRLTTGEAPAYSAFSPHWGMEPITYQGRKAFRPVHLFSVGLCNRPQIPGSFIGLNEALPAETSPSQPMNEHLLKLLAALGFTVAADAPEATLSTAINEALPKVQAALQAQGELATVRGELATAQASLQTAVNEAATLRGSLATERTARAGVLITTAINEGRLTEAGRAEWLGKFTAAGADFAAVEGDLAKLVKAVNTASRTSDMGQRRGKPASSEQKQRIAAINEAITAKCGALGLDPSDGGARVTAYNTLQREGHALFTPAQA